MPASEKILVTGGAGFIGANFVLDWLRETGESVVNLDKLTYAGNLENLAALEGDARHVFVRGDIGDRALMDRLLAEHRPRAIVHFAAESHVDRSIHGPGEFIRTNIDGTFTLLEAVRGYWGALTRRRRKGSAFSTFPPTRFTARWGRRMRRSPRPRPTRRTARTPLRKRRPITWYALITIRMACPC